MYPSNLQYLEKNCPTSGKVRKNTTLLLVRH